MLSGESAMGKYPEEAVAMLARIAAYTEAHRPPTRLNDLKAMGVAEVFPPGSPIDAGVAFVKARFDKQEERE